jgi:hypothetical protein
MKKKPEPKRRTGEARHGPACPSCQSRSSAVVRTEARGDGTARVRRCRDCSRTWQTVESATGAIPVALSLETIIRALEIPSPNGAKRRLTHVHGHVILNSLARSRVELGNLLRSGTPLFVAPVEVTEARIAGERPRGAGVYQFG